MSQQNITTLAEENFLNKNNVPLREAILLAVFFQWLRGMSKRYLHMHIILTSSHETNLLSRQHSI